MTGSNQTTIGDQQHVAKVKLARQFTEAFNSSGPENNARARVEVEISMLSVLKLGTDHHRYREVVLTSCHSDDLWLEIVKHYFSRPARKSAAI